MRKVVPYKNGAHIRKVFHTIRAAPAAGGRAAPSGSGGKVGAGMLYLAAISSVD